MKEEFSNFLDEKLDQLDNNVDDNSISIDELVSIQNQKIKYISILEEAKRNGFDINYSDEMSLEELGELVENLKKWFRESN